MVAVDYFIKFDGITGESADAKRRRAIKDFIAECYKCTDIGVRRKLDFGTDKKQKPDVCPYLSMAAHPR